MKKRTLLILTVMTASLAFTACSPAKEDETAQLKEQIAQLEQQVQDLQDGSAPSGTSANGTMDIGTTGTASQNTSDIPDIDSLSTRIQDLEQQVGDITPTGSAQEQWEQYHSLEQDIESTEHDLDRLEDALEFQYESGTLDAASYRKAEQTIEILEDRLDQCEDQLEFKFKLS